jgi:hypothetical protein
MDKALSLAYTIVAKVFIATGVATMLCKRVWNVAGKTTDFILKVIERIIHDET